LVGKNDKELNNGRSQAEKEALCKWLIAKNRQNEKKSPDAAPDQTWIEPLGRESWGKSHPEIHRNLCLAEEPKHNAVGQPPKTAG